MKSRESSLAIRHGDFRPSAALAMEQAALLVSFLAVGATIAAGPAGPAPIWVGAGVIAGLSGLPQVSIPVGTMSGCPIGLSFVGWAGGDEALLDLAFALSSSCGLEG